MNPWLSLNAAPHRFRIPFLLLLALWAGLLFGGAVLGKYDP